MDFFFLPFFRDILSLYQLCFSLASLIHRLPSSIWYKPSIDFMVMTTKHNDVVLLAILTLKAMGSQLRPNVRVVFSIITFTLDPLSSTTPINSFLFIWTLIFATLSSHIFGKSIGCAMLHAMPLFVASNSAFKPCIP